MFVRFLAHSFATIANFQWFSKLPSPLNGMVEGNHWDQWFSDGFGVRQPLITMVFDGCAPLVRRWNGYVPSSKSSPMKRQVYQPIGPIGALTNRRRGFQQIKAELALSQRLPRSDCTDSIKEKLRNSAFQLPIAE